MSCASTFTWRMARSAENSVRGVSSSRRGSGTATVRTLLKMIATTDTSTTTNAHASACGSALSRGLGLDVPFSESARGGPVTLVRRVRRCVVGIALAGFRR